MPRNPRSTTLHPSVIEADYFDPELYDLYWRFIAERQWMWVRRAHFEQPRPWTTDQVLNSEFITNNYRELDPGTEYVIKNLLNIKSKDDRVFAVLLFRLMGSQIGANERVASLLGVKKFKAAKFTDILTEYATNGGGAGKIFGDAYRVAGYETEGGTSKINNVGLMFERLASNWPTIMEPINAATNAREGYEAIKAIPGFGEFLAHQISVDLLYENASGEAVFPFGQDQYAVAGPGARQGIWAMLKPNIKPQSLLLVMRYLHDRQEAEFAERGICFPYLLDEKAFKEQDERKPLLLSVCNIQSTLCEFFKYLRLWDGSTTNKRRYEPSGTVLTKYPTYLSREELDTAEVKGQLTPRPPVGGRQPVKEVEPTEPMLDDTESAPAVVGPLLVETGGGGGSSYSSFHYAGTTLPLKDSSSESPELGEVSLNPAPGITINIVINMVPQPSGG